MAGLPEPFAFDLESAGIKINAACPGFTATDVNNFEGTRTVQQAAGEPVRAWRSSTRRSSSEDGPIQW